VGTQPADYITATDAARLTGKSYPSLSQLCRPAGPVRYWRPSGRRLMIHAADLARWMKE
jgi:hypothetical protein